MSRSDQTTFDFSSRGGQLRLLERVRLPMEGGRTSDSSRMAVLKAIDDCIGKDREWTIPLSRICGSTSLSRATVSRAVADLSELQLIDVEDRYRAKTGGGVQRLPCRFRIVWSNLPDFLPGRPAVVEDSREFCSRRTETPSPHTETGSRQTETPSPHTETGSRQTEAHSPASNTRPIPSPVIPETRDGEGRDSGSGSGRMLWREVVAKPALLVAAVKGSDVVFLGRLWSEAVRAGWQVDGRDPWRRFLAACFYVVRPPSGFTIRNPARVLRDKCIEDRWKTGRMDGADDDWARQMARKAAGKSERVSESCRDVEEFDTGRAAAIQAARLREAFPR